MAASLLGLGLLAAGAVWAQGTTRPASELLAPEETTLYYQLKTHAPPAGQRPHALDLAPASPAAGPTYIYTKPAAPQAPPAPVAPGPQPTPAPSLPAPAFKAAPPQAAPPATRPPEPARSPSATPPSLTLPAPSQTPPQAAPPAARPPEVPRLPSATPPGLTLPPPQGGPQVVKPAAPAPVLPRPHAGQPSDLPVLPLPAPAQPQVRPQQVPQPAPARPQAVTPPVQQGTHWTPAPPPRQAVPPLGAAGLRQPPQKPEQPPRADEKQEYAIQLDIPGPKRLYQLESEASLKERMRQEARKRGESLVFPEEPVLTKETYRGRNWSPMAMQVEPHFVCYGRLLFEQKNFERYGWDLGVFSPVLGVGKFYLDVALLPYHLGTRPCQQYECSAGYCLPGDPVPLLLYPPELSATGLAAEASAVTGMFLAFP
jgi:hypothetical protein